MKCGQGTRVLVSPTPVLTHNERRSAQLPTRTRVTSLIMRLKYLRLGASRPTSCVALFHGLGGSRHELRELAEHWLSALPSTAFLLFEAPDRDYHERKLLTGDWSGDWYRYPALRSAFGDDEAAYTSMVTRCISNRCDQVSAELDDHLSEMDVDNDRLVLAGFSQGAAVSAYTALRRRCLAAMPFGGPCPPRQSLLPDNEVTHICAIVGDADHCVPHEEITSSFAERYSYRGKDVQCRTHVIPGMGHVVGSPHMQIGRAFLERVLQV